MKLAVAGKGGVGKTSVCVWLGDFLSRNGHQVWLIDADSTMSLGLALGLQECDFPPPLLSNEEILRERVGLEGLMTLNPLVDDLPEKLCVEVDLVRLIVMGSISGAGQGCACRPNSLLKAVLSHMMTERNESIIVDMEAGVEHLGRGTIEAIDGLIIVLNKSKQSREIGKRISSLARDLGVSHQIFVLNRANSYTKGLDGLEFLPIGTSIPEIASLNLRNSESCSVLGLSERDTIDKACAQILSFVT